MSDVAPEAGPAPDKPVETVPHGSSDEQAARILRERRVRANRRPPPPRPSAVSPPPADPPAETSQPEPAPAPAEVEARSPAEVPAEQPAPVQETQAEEASEFPGTLDDLASALGVEPRDLAEAVTAKAKINGREIDISIQEAVEGYQRQQDYDRRQGELAEARRAAEAEQARITSEANEQIRQAGVWLGVLGNALQAGPSDQQLAQLAAQDPDAYNQARAHRDHLTSQFHQVQQGMAQMQHQEAERRQAAEATAFESEKAELLRLARNKAEGMPNLEDPQALATYQGKLSSYMADRGVPQEAISAFLKPQGWKAYQVAILNDAMRWRESQKQGSVAEKVKRLPSPLKPQAAKAQRTEQDRVAEARAKLRATGTDKSAIAMLRAKRVANAARSTARRART